LPQSKQVSYRTINSTQSTTIRHYYTCNLKNLPDIKNLDNVGEPSNMAADSYHNTEGEDPMSSSSNEDNNHLSSSGNNILTAIKLIAATALFYSAGTSFSETYQQHLAYKNAVPSSSNSNTYNNMPTPSNHIYANTPVRENGRRLSETNISKKNPPSYMKDLMDELAERTKLMTETPPEEVKYWFEYTGPLQVSLIGYRFVSYFVCWWLYVYVYLWLFYYLGAP